MIASIIFYELLLFMDAVMWKMCQNGNDDGDRNPDGLSTDILQWVFS